MKALRRDPEERYGSALELSLDIARAVPSLIFDARQASALMTGLFDEELRRTGALVEGVNRRFPVAALTGAADALAQATRVSRDLPPDGGAEVQRAHTDILGPITTGVMRLEVAPPPDRVPRFLEGPALPDFSPDLPPGPTRWRAPR